MPLGLVSHLWQCLPREYMSPLPGHCLSPERGFLTVHMNADSMSHLHYTMSSKGQFLCLIFSLWANDVLSIQAQVWCMGCLRLGSPEANTRVRICVQMNSLESVLRRNRSGEGKKLSKDVISGDMPPDRRIIWALISLLAPESCAASFSQSS